MAEGFNLLGDIEHLKKQIQLENLGVAREQQSAFNPIAAQIQAQFMDIGIDKDSRIKSAKSVQDAFKKDLKGGKNIEEALQNSAQTMLSEGNIPAAQWLISKSHEEKAKRMEIDKLRAEIEGKDATTSKTIQDEKKSKAETARAWAGRDEIRLAIETGRLLQPFEVASAKIALRTATQQHEMAYRKFVSEQSNKKASTENMEASARNLDELARGRRNRNAILEEAVKELDETQTLSEVTRQKLIAANILPGEKAPGFAEALMQTIPALGGTAQEAAPPPTGEVQL